MKSPLRKVLRSAWAQRTAGFLAAQFLRLVWITNRFSYDPVRFYETVDPHLPVIVAFWHGQHFMVPFARRSYHRASVLISKSFDGEINAIAAEHLGAGTVRGSGDHGTSFHRKGGVGAFKEMMRVLVDEKANMVLTADVPKRARVAGLGIVMLARETGRPIFPLGVATSRYLRLANWDQSTIHLPFGRGAFVLGEPIVVLPDAGDDAMETIRARVEASINDVTRRAYVAVGRPEGAPRD